MAMMHFKQEPLDMSCADKRFLNKTDAKDIISVKNKVHMFGTFDAPINYGCDVKIKEEGCSHKDGSTHSQIFQTSKHHEPLELITKRNPSVVCKSVMKREGETVTSKHLTSGHIIKFESNDENGVNEKLCNKMNKDNFSEFNKSIDSDDSLLKNMSCLKYFDSSQLCIISANLTGKKLYDFPRANFRHWGYLKNSDSKRSVYVCDICNHISKRPTDLKSHKITHSDETPYICEECGYTCRKLSNLKSHRQTHSGEKSFVCDVCGYSSNFFNNLKTHKIIHTGEKPFSCLECSYTCGRPSNLKRHMLKHSQLRTFACNECSYMSKDVTGLKVHKLVHTGKKPHVCDVCPSSYVTLKSLNHHKKKHFNLNLAS